MAVAAEGTGADAALTAGFSVASSRLPVSVERPGRCAGTVVHSTACSHVPGPVPRVDAGVNSARTAVNSAAPACSSVVVAPVIKRAASGVVPAAVIPCVSVMPIESPMAPAPAKAAVPADSEADSEIEIRAAKPNSRIRIPSRPSHDGIAVNQPRVIGRDVNYIGISGLNVNVWAIVPYDFLRSSLEAAGLFRFMAHHLHRVHHILLLIVISVAER